MRHLEVIERSRRMPLVSSLVRAQGNNFEPIEILEAGCGQRWMLKLEGKKFTLIGVDIDKDALEIRKNVQMDLDEAIHGDLRTVSFGDRRFEVVYSAFVLEHIDGAEDVLTRMISWLKPNGIIVIEIPDPASVKGWVTRITPHWFHIFYYRYILGEMNAGNPGFAPYRTIYDPVVSRSGIHNFCARHNLRIDAEYGFRTSGPRNKLLRTLMDSTTQIISLLTLGSLSDKHTDLLYVLRKPA